MTKNNRIRRPKILVTAAKIGARDYRRGRTVARLVNNAVNLKRADVIDALANAEQQIEAARVQGDLSYSALRHVELLSALISERSNRREPL